MTAFHLHPPDARRGGLVIVGAGRDGRLGALCETFAGQGYEVLAPEPGGDLAVVAAGLREPVFLLTIGEPEQLQAFKARSVAAISLFEPSISAIETSAPTLPTIAHFAMAGGPVSASALEALRERRPDLALYPYAVSPGLIWRDDDAARLACLRTLQLFHRSSGARGEMGG